MSDLRLRAAVGEDRQGEHHAVQVLLPDVGDEQHAHVGPRAAAQQLAHLETLEAVAVLGLLADDVEDGVNELGTLIHSSAKAHPILFTKK